MSIDASKEWSEADKEKIESWRSSEKVTERIIRGQKDGEDWYKELENLSKKRFVARPEGKAYNEESLTAAEVATSANSSRQNEITGSRRINPGRAKTQGE